MRRRCEPELMDDPAQARAYDRADFSAAHQWLAGLLTELLPGSALTGRVADLGCGSGDYTTRLARLHPGSTVDAVDGSRAMLDLAAKRLRAPDLRRRVRLHHRQLPRDGLPLLQYEAIVANSLLHHLRHPDAVWRLCRRHLGPGGVLFFTDLRRPNTAAAAHTLAKAYSANDPPLVQRDFAASLRAAFTVQEVRGQLRRCDLAWAQVTAVGDRHLAVYGVAPKARAAP